MNKSIRSNFVLFLGCIVFALGNQLHAQQAPVVIYGGTVHVGDGTIIQNGMVVLRNGLIEYAGPANAGTYDSNVVSWVNARNKHVYPGFIGLQSELGLKEIEAVRSTRDVYEVGVFNPNVRSLIAYNTDSKVIPTLRSNGILLAQVVPKGGTISGQSSVMKLSGWNWEDAVVATDGNMHMQWPGAYRYDYVKNTIVINPDYQRSVDAIRVFLSEAKAYCSTTAPAIKNLRFEAMRKIFSGEQKMFIRANQAKEIIGAASMAKELGIKMVLVGGRQSYRVAALLKEQQIPVLLESTHELPPFDSDPVDLTFSLPAMLQDAGILVGLTISNDGSAYWNLRNLGFQAGTAVAYGLNAEEALRMITLNNAQIAGIDARFGTIATGKSATVFVSEGDALDMRGNSITHIFIAGERIKPENWQDQLEDTYRLKYGITPKK